MEKWINKASSLPTITECDDLLAKKIIAKEIFESNLRLSASEASGTAQHPWDFLAETKNSFKNSEIFANCALLEPREGIEPSTSFLPRKRSATELSGHVGHCLA